MTSAATAPRVDNDNDSHACPGPGPGISAIKDTGFGGGDRGEVWADGHRRGSRLGRWDRFVGSGRGEGEGGLRAGHRAGRQEPHVLVFVAGVNVAWVGLVWFANGQLLLSYAAVSSHGRQQKGK